MRSLKVHKNSPLYPLSLLCDIQMADRDATLPASEIALPMKVPKKLPVSDLKAIENMFLPRCAMQESVWDESPW